MISRETETRQPRREGGLHPVSTTDLVEHRRERPVGHLLPARRHDQLREDEPPQAQEAAVLDREAGAAGARLEPVGQLRGRALPIAVPTVAQQLGLARLEHLAIHEATPGAIRLAEQAE